jgi:hypothetical protein
MWSNVYEKEKDSAAVMKVEASTVGLGCSSVQSIVCFVCMMVLVLWLGGVRKGCDSS